MHSGSLILPAGSPIFILRSFNLNHHGPCLARHADSPIHGSCDLKAGNLLILVQGNGILWSFFILRIWHDHGMPLSCVILSIADGEDASPALHRPAAFLCPTAANPAITHHGE